MIFAVAALAAALDTAPRSGPQQRCEVASGLGTRACIFPEGQVVVETDLIDRTIDRGGGIDTHGITFGDTLVHVGLRRGLEVQLGIAAYQREHTRLPTGERLRSSGIGDVTVGGKVALVDPVDHAFGLSLQPTLSIPVGDLELGAHGLGGGLLLAASYDLSDTLTVELTPQADYTSDRADDDRHWEYGATAGLGWTIDEALTATGEVRHLRDRDPAYRRTTNVGALSIGWSPAHRLQLNLGAATGLDRRSPRLQLIAGFALHLF